MFQDEARFGRMTKPKRCWASKGCRPVMANGYEREFTYVYGAVSPVEGEMEWMRCKEMNTARMSEFLAQVSARYATDFILMVLDGASSHKAKALSVPANVRLVPLPPYAPELNPQEHIWDELREKEFPNRVYDRMEQVTEQLDAGIPRLCADHARVRSITAWPWILKINLKAN
jgi:transposase